jgi:catechol 2,3-dioxygenase-like lactoylglutathione lyase family enzyme
MTAAGDPGELAGVLETCLYHEPGEADAVERFYTERLGLRVVSRWPGGIALRAGAGVLLLFDRAVLTERDGPISAHGTIGPGHACLLASEDAYDGWRDRLAASGIEITHEHEWDGGRRSLYFTDPAGNLLEIAEGDIWPSDPA